MRNLLNMHFMISLHLFIIAGVIALGAFTVHEAKNDVRAELLRSIEEQSLRLKTLLATTDNNGADEVIAAIITDCPNRNEFERKLGTLGSLNHRDLLTVQQLFDSCGHFYAERKALMVAKIDREHEVLKTQIDLLRSLGDEEPFELTIWQELVSAEVKRSDMLKEQTQMQSSIISELIAGRGVSDPTIQSYVERSRNLDESLAVLNTQIDELRDRLVE